MLDFSGSTTVYLACGVTDLRKSYTGLAANQDSPMGRVRILDPNETAGEGCLPLARYTGRTAQSYPERDPLAMRWIVVESQRRVCGAPPEDHHLSRILSIRKKQKFPRFDADFPLFAEVISDRNRILFMVYSPVKIAER